MLYIVVLYDIAMNSRGKKLETKKMLYNREAEAFDGSVRQTQGTVRPLELVSVLRDPDPARSARAQHESGDTSRSTDLALIAGLSPRRRSRGVGGSLLRDGPLRRGRLRGMGRRRWPLQDTCRLAIRRERDTESEGTFLHEVGSRAARRLLMPFLAWRNGLVKVKRPFVEGAVEHLILGAFASPAEEARKVVRDGRHWIHRWLLRSDVGRRRLGRIPADEEEKVLPRLGEGVRPRMVRLNGPLADLAEKSGRRGGRDEGWVVVGEGGQLLLVAGLEEDLLLLRPVALHGALAVARDHGSR